MSMLVFIESIINVILGGEVGITDSVKYLSHIQVNLMLKCLFILHL